MAINVEAGRAAGRGRASEEFLAGNTSEVEQTAANFNRQIAWLCARFQVGEAHARAIAEHAFAKGTLR